MNKRRTLKAEKKWMAKQGAKAERFLTQHHYSFKARDNGDQHEALSLAGTFRLMGEKEMAREWLGRSFGLRCAYHFQWTDADQHMQDHADYWSEVSYRNSLLED